MEEAARQETAEKEAEERVAAVYAWVRTGSLMLQCTSNPPLISKLRDAERWLVIHFRWQACI